MPYIPKTGRVGIDEHLNLVQTTTPGELNYAITKLLLNFLGDANVTYARINTVVGILECVKLEMYRRLAAPYEDRQKGDNGDVY